MAERDIFDPLRYEVIDKETGEIIPVQIFVDSKHQKWDMAFAKTLAEVLEISGDPNTLTLAAMLKRKDSQNRIHGTIREIAEDSGVSTKTVNRLITKLKASNFLKRIRNGCYMLSPHIMRHGAKTQGAMVLRIWKKLDDIEY